MHTISFRLRPTFIFHDLKFLFLQRAVQCYRPEHRGTIKAKLRPTDPNEIKDPLYLKRNIFISLEFVCPSSKRFVVFVLRTVGGGGALAVNKLHFLRSHFVLILYLMNEGRHVAQLSVVYMPLQLSIIKSL